MRLFLVLLLLFPHTVYAEEPLTGLEIEELFQTLEKLYTQDAPDMSSIITFTKTHTTEDAQFVHVIKTNLRNDLIEKDFGINDLIADLANPEKELKQSSLRHTITDILYAENKNSAEVKYTSLFTGIVKMPGENVGKSSEYAVVGFKSLSICSEFFRLENAAVKRYKTDCKIEIIYDDAKAVE